jgi:CRP/FNR family transcriptional regulator, anaerobic regulatory protein
MTNTTEISMAIAPCLHSTISSSAARLERTGQWSTLADVCQLLQLDIKVHDEALDTLFQHRHLKSGQQAYGIGQPFEALYVVNAGFLKTVLFDPEGNERVVCFPMKGDLLGSDGICTDRHACEVITLSDCDIIVIPFKQLLTLGHCCQELEHIIYRAVSRQIVQENVNLATLGSLRSDARVARFLIMEADRYAALKYSSQSFRLRMTRRDIGSYLGLTLETVSRSMSALDAVGIISVNQREIEILKMGALRSLQHVESSHATTSREVKLKQKSNHASAVPSMGKHRTHATWAMH